MNELVGRFQIGFLIKHKWLILFIVICLIVSQIWPDIFIETLLFVVQGMIDVSYLVIPGILVSAWVTASGAGGKIREAFQGSQFSAIIMASFVGAITPVCGITVLPLMVGLLA